MRKDTRKWKNGFYESVYGSIFFAFLACCFSIALTKNMWTSILNGFVTLLLFFIILRNHRKSIYKFFLIDVETGKQVVAHVLDAKGIPYKRDEHHFYVGALTIIVEKSKSNFSVGAIVMIRPYKTIHYPLIKSLQDKIDEAFMLYT